MDKPKPQLSKLRLCILWWSNEAKLKQRFKGCCVKISVEIAAILFDVIGTTILESGKNVVNHCFEQAFRLNGVSISPSEIQAIRGKDKNDAIVAILKSKGSPLELTPNILNSFSNAFKKELTSFSENPDLPELVDYLTFKNITIGIGTGLPEELFRILFDHFHWAKHRFQYIGVAEKIGRGRPDPAMIHEMIFQLRLEKQSFLKVGDTPDDIWEGKNAGVRTAALLSGTVDASLIYASHPDFILNGLCDLKQIA